MRLQHNKDYLKVRNSGGSMRDLRARGEPRM